MNYKKPSDRYTASPSHADRSPRRSPASSQHLAPCGSSLKSIAFGVMRSILANLGDLARFLLPLAFAAMLLGGVLATLWDATGLPIVYKSYTTRQCVKVENIDGTPGDCSNLPDRYHHTWVE